MSVGFLRNARQRRPRDSATALHIGGFTGLSCTDFPGALSAVVFCQGCPWRCFYCHNPHLLDPRGRTSIAWSHVVSFLERRRGLLDAVVFSGGEPTVQPCLADAMRTARQLGYRVGLHTAGIYPRRLRVLLPLADWVALDVKGPFESYGQTTSMPDSGPAALESLQLMLASGVDYEVRTTVLESLLPAATLAKLATTLAGLGVQNYAVQACRGQGCAEPVTAQAETYLSDQFCQELAPLFDSFTVRRT